MEYKNEIRDLRKRVPISIIDAIALLKKNNGDIDLSEQEFKNKSIADICTKTKVVKNVAERHYEACGFDIAKTITSILNEIYDENYVRPDFLTKEKLDVILNWLKLEETEIFEVALSHPYIEVVIETLICFDSLQQIGLALKKVKTIFDSYNISETMDAKKYVEAINKLRENKDYILQQDVFKQNKYKIDDELEKHYRNIDKF